jgi:pimeloyl-ACP methyl ester carboxylesterase
VVFEAGLDMNGSLAWNLVHDSVAATTRACAYSRAGIMWSDPHRGAHDAMAVAGDLHAALSAAGERPPYVLVGHSLGGPYIVTYTKRYGDDVAGLVFVDASHPDQVRRMRELLGRELNPPMGIIKAAAALSWTGVLRAVPRPIPPHWPVEAARAAAAYVPTSLGSMLEEGDALDTTLAQAGELRNLGDRPIVVLTAMAPMDSSILASLEIDRAKGEEFQALWRSLHDEEASWSTRSQHQVLTDATHYVQFDRPDAVIAAVRSVVDSVRLKP